MSNPFSGIITADHKRLYSNMIKAAIEALGMGVLCTLYYAPTKPDICPNCNKNPITGMSAGTYKVGGPFPFTNGACPECSGAGKKIVQATEDIELAAIFDPKKFIPVGRLELKDGYIQTISLYSSLPQIRRASEILINSGVEEYLRNKYKRDGDPVLLGEGLSDESFAVTYWKKV